MDRWIDRMEGDKRASDHYSLASIDVTATLVLLEASDDCIDNMRFDNDDIRDFSASLERYRRTSLPRITSTMRMPATPRAMAVSMYSTVRVLPEMVFAPPSPVTSRRTAKFVKCDTRTLTRYRSPPSGSRLVSLAGSVTHLGLLGSLSSMYPIRTSVRFVPAAIVATKLNVIGCLNTIVPPKIPVAVVPSVKLTTGEKSLNRMQCHHLIANPSSDVVRRYTKHAGETVTYSTGVD